MILLTTRIYTWGSADWGDSLIGRPGFPPGPWLHSPVAGSTYGTEAMTELPITVSAVPSMAWHVVAAQTRLDGWMDR